MPNQDNFEIDFFLKEGLKPSENAQDSLAFIFTAKLIDVFNSKIKEFKIDNSKSINLSQLKNVYKISAELYGEETPPARNRGHFALARVNMFIRMVSEKRGFYKEIKGSKIKISQFLFDSSGCFLPTEEDYVIASIDIEKNELTYDFQNINDLYLEAPEDSRFWFEL